MKKINKKDLEVKTWTVTALNGTRVKSDDTKTDDTVNDYVCNTDYDTKEDTICNRDTTAHKTLNEKLCGYTLVEGAPTCVGHTMGENETCVNCGSGTLCYTAAEGCVETVEADTCDVTVSKGVLCCDIPTDKSDCCLERPSKDVCPLTDDCNDTTDMLCKVSGTDCLNTVDCVDSVDMCAASVDFDCGETVVCI